MREATCVCLWTSVCRSQLSMEEKAGHLAKERVVLGGLGEERWMAAEF